MDKKQDNLTRCDEGVRDDLKDQCDPEYNGENAISGRSDLNPENGTYPIPSLGHRNHAAIDMKITSRQLMKNGLQIRAISGPTDQNVPPFDWRKSGFGKSNNYFGMPYKWTFGPVTHKWILPDPEPSNSANKSQWSVSLIASVLLAKILMSS